jgi:hypothetical protein
MATLKDMIDEVRSNLAGYTMRQDRITYLANSGGITTTSTAIVVGSAVNLAKGIIEIDDELIWIDSFDKATNTMNVIPGFGRGYQNTDPAPHSQYAQVTLAPTFPKVMVKQAINDTIRSVFPKLFAVAQYTFTFNASQTTYALPDDVDRVLSVTWSTTGPSKEWLPVNRWRDDKAANISAFNSSASISIFDPITPGRTVQITYTTAPATLDSSLEEYADVTGLPESSRDIITLGAAYRLLSYIDVGRINLTSAESDAADSRIPSNASAAASRLLYGLFQQRLNDESMSLIDRYPVRPHYTR